MAKNTFKPKKVPDFQEIGFEKLSKMQNLFEATASCLQWTIQSGDAVCKPAAQAALIGELRSEMLLNYIAVARTHMGTVLGQANELAIKAVRQIILEERKFAQLKVERAIKANVARYEFFSAWKGKEKELDKLVAAVRDAKKSQTDHMLACQELLQRSFPLAEKRPDAIEKRRASEKRMLTLMVKDRAFMLIVEGQLTGWMREEVEQRGSGPAAWEDLEAEAITKMVRVMKPLFRQYKVEAVARNLTNRPLMDKVFMMLPEKVQKEIEVRSFDPFNVELWQGCTDEALSQIAYEIRKAQLLTSPRSDLKITSTPKKLGSAAKRKPRVRDENGKIVNTSTRSLTAREARQKSKRKG